VKLDNSPVTQHDFDGFSFDLKRDDQLHSHFNGNKARKFLHILQNNYPGVTRLIGWGSAQANTLTSLAALANIKGWRLTYYVDHMPTWLNDNPKGNYRTALELGAEIIALSETQGSNGLHPSQYIKEHHSTDPQCLCIPEGGRFQEAKTGIDTLAKELLSWTRFEPHKTFVVALPSGTGTTALYLHRALSPHGIEVITCPCVGGKDYLIKQFEELEPNSSYPTVLEMPSKHHFAKLYQEDYEIWNDLNQQTHVEFDLLYDPLMWRCLRGWLKENPDKSLLYVHQGGLLGNETMLARYQRKFPRSGISKQRYRHTKGSTAFDW
jgi:1-aminocyclopropane-1-carboxylate deaminase/D-cysteine desulfhydrase-like pyridoxal-dependent ACC family enzyme